jgi:hypothetical protein
MIRALLTTALGVLTVAVPLAHAKIIPQNWKSCAIGQLSDDANTEADWRAVPVWTRNPDIAKFFDNDPRMLALHGLCNARYHRVVLCLPGWQEDNDPRDEVCRLVLGH